jgi:hypothetical protein
LDFEKGGVAVVSRFIRKKRARLTGNLRSRQKEGTRIKVTPIEKRKQVGFSG